MQSQIKEKIASINKNINIHVAFDKSFVMIIVFET